MHVCLIEYSKNDVDTNEARKAIKRRRRKLKRNTRNLRHRHNQHNHNHQRKRKKFVKMKYS